MQVHQLFFGGFDRWIRVHPKTLDVNRNFGPNKPLKPSTPKALFFEEIRGEGGREDGAGGKEWI